MISCVVVRRFAAPGARAGDGDGIGDGDGVVEEDNSRQDRKGSVSTLIGEEIGLAGA